LHVPGLRRALREVLIEGGSNLFGNLEICSVFPLIISPMF
jgi:hypothetical protein